PLAAERGPAVNTLYGQNGTPVGSIDEFAYYDAEGRQLGEVNEGYLFSTRSTRDVAVGAWTGTFVNGVVYNHRGYPQAFTAGATKGAPLVAPKIPSLLTNRVLAKGFDVRG